MIFSSALEAFLFLHVLRFEPVPIGSISCALATLATAKKKKKTIKHLQFIAGFLNYCLKITLDTTLQFLITIA